MNFQMGKLYWDFATMVFFSPAPYFDCSPLPADVAGIASGRFHVPVPVGHGKLWWWSIMLHSPWDLPQHLLQIPRHGNKPQAGEDTVLLRSEVAAFSGKSWMQSCCPPPPYSCSSTSGHPIKVPEEAISVSPSLLMPCP